MSPAARGVERYVAFLKGINVGGHTVKMERLRGLFAEVEVGGSPLESVESFIASGNIIFSSNVSGRRRIEAAVATRLESALGYTVPTFVRTVEALRRVAAADPFPDVDPGPGGPSLYIAFLPHTPDAAAVERIEADSDRDRWFTAEEALDYGFIDAVIDRSRMPSPGSPS